jgi:hypothetical protein
MVDITDNLFSGFLQKNLVINHNNRVLREGRLILFSIKDFHLHFTLEIKGAMKHFELPYPFDVIEVNKNLLLLNFALSAFRAEYKDLDKKIKNIGEKKKSRFYNSIIQLIAEE